MADGAYAAVQMSNPRSLTVGLNDSPVGVASWILDRFHSWTDSGDNIEKSVSRDDLLTNITLYWATQMIGSSIGREELPRQLPSKYYRVNKGTPYAIFIRHRSDCRPKVRQG